MKGQLRVLLQKILKPLAKVYKECLNGTGGQERASVSLTLEDSESSERCDRTLVRLSLAERKLI